MTITSASVRCRRIAAVSPPKPAPMITTCGRRLVTETEEISTFANRSINPSIALSSVATEIWRSGRAGGNTAVRSIRCVPPINSKRTQSRSHLASEIEGGHGDPHGDAPDPLLSGRRRHAEFYARGGTMPCIAAGADTRYPTARRGAGWAFAAARTEIDASDRFWPVDRTAFAPAPRRCRCREIDGQAVSQPAGGRDPPRRHVHGRPGSLHEFSRPFPQRQSWMRNHSRRGHAGAALGTATARRARSRRDGSARALPPTLRRSATLSRAVLHRLPDRSSVGSAEPRQHLRCRRRDVLAANQLRIPRLSRRAAARARACDAGWLSERTRGLDSDDGRSRVRRLLSARVFADHPWRADPARQRTGSRSRRLIGLDGRPAVFARGVGLHPRDPRPRLVRRSERLIAEVGSVPTMH